MSNLPDVDLIDIINFKSGFHVLSHTSRDVFDESSLIPAEYLSKLSDRMLELMYREEGLGLSAIQVGIPIKLFVMSLADSKDNYGQRHLVVCDPKISSESEIVTARESCLSFPNLSVKMNRFNSIRLEYKDVNGNDNFVDFTGVNSIIAQHEYDHLIGDNILNHVSPLKYKEYMRRI